jgi:hypothetical protein
MPNMPTHTPGPWTVTGNRRERTIQIDTANGRGTVVQPNAISWTPDAVLIAQAPEMWALIDRMQQFCPEALRHEARALLARCTARWMGTA